MEWTCNNQNTDGETYWSCITSLY